MKTYTVTLSLITGYPDGDFDNPILKHVDFTVQAENETEARAKAKELDKSKLSVYESWASED